MTIEPNLFDKNSKVQIPAKLKQPPGLANLFMGEFWERFGFYVLEGLFILYLTKALGFPDSTGYNIVGAFMAFAYIATILGGFVADKIIGFKNSIIIGGIFLIIGYACLATLDRNLMYPGLAIVIVGMGLFKPNISSLLGTFYAPGDMRRDAGFTIFYMGINLGIVLATISAGYIKEYLGWGASFGAASVGLVIGLATFLSGMRKFRGYGLAPSITDKTSKIIKLLKNKFILVIGFIVAILFFTFLIRDKTLANIALWLTGIIVIIGLTIAVRRQKEIRLRNNMTALIILTLSSVVFWAVFFQIFFSVNLFTDRNIDHNVFGFHIPTVAFISLESIFIILLGPLFAKLWTNLHRKNKSPSLPMKFTLGTFVISFAFLVFSMSTHFHNAHGLINPLWIVLGYLLITVGEMLLSPIGLAAVTELSPPQLTGIMMGVWFIALGFGGKLAGVIADFSSIPANVTDIIEQSQYYGRAFLQYAILSFIVAIIILALTPLLKKLITVDRAIID